MDIMILRLGGHTTTEPTAPQKFHEIVQWMTRHISMKAP